MTESEIRNNVESMLDASIALCQVLLSHNDTFYPFASISIDGDIQTIFTDEKAFESEKLIELLETEIWQSTMLVPESLSVLVYLGFISDEFGDSNEVIVCDVMMHNDEQQQLFFPVQIESGQVVIGSPFTLE